MEVEVEEVEGEVEVEVEGGVEVEVEERPPVLCLPELDEDGGHGVVHGSAPPPEQVLEEGREDRIWRHLEYRHILVRYFIEDLLQFLLQHVFSGDVRLSPKSASPKVVIIRHLLFDPV